MKVEWHRRLLGVKPALAEVMPALAPDIGPVTPAQEGPSGDELLESSQVEREELGLLAKLPPFEPVAISLVRLFDREYVAINEIARLVAADPSMTSELLAVVNSPLFAFRHRVTSPGQAITLLGVERTKSLAVTLAMRSMMQGAPKTPVVRRFWMHSLATSTTARHFAPAFGIEPELAHVAALMHDLGRLGLLSAHPAEYTRLALTAHEAVKDILAAEKAAFGLDHCRAGGILSKAWNLPAIIRKVIERHHGCSARRDLLSLVQLCCRLADDLMFQSIHHREGRQPEETVATRAPEGVRAQVMGGLEAAGAAVIAAIETLDF
ncbi:MAG TPA: HDOD domain-containing protein [Bryobacteraceae bacterium]|nr:HDOD domain-containing protein [Bryobacteraceae bacterium]